MVVTGHLILALSVITSFYPSRHRDPRYFFGIFIWRYFFGPHVNGAVAHERPAVLLYDPLCVWYRTQAGRLHLVDSVGKIPLADVTLVEDPAEDERNDDGKHHLDGENHLTVKLTRR